MKGERDEYPSKLNPVVLPGFHIGEDPIGIT